MSHSNIFQQIMKQSLDRDPFNCRLSPGSAEAIIAMARAKAKSVEVVADALGQDVSDL